MSVITQAVQRRWLDCRKSSALREPLATKPMALRRSVVPSQADSSSSTIATTGFLCIPKHSLRASKLAPHSATTPLRAGRNAAHEPKAHRDECRTEMDPGD